MKKQASKKWQARRAKIVASAAFIKLFEKAKQAMRDPHRKTCVHGHPIKPANAHVGDLRRTKRYSCDPCWRKQQAKYLAAQA